MSAGIPPSITAVVLLTDLALATVVLAGTALGARRAGLGRATRRRVLAVAAAVLAGWFAVAAAVTATRPSVLDPLVLGLIGGPVVLGYGLYLRSTTWRRIVRAVPQSWLVGAQVYRNVGAVFLLLWVGGRLPAYFAIPAGVGDVVTGVGALVVAVLVVRGVRGWRTATVGWNLFGIADLVVAVGAGSTLLAGPLSSVFAAETTTAVVVRFPLGTIPTFLVPISVTLHLYSLAGIVGGSPGDSGSPSDGTRRSGRERPVGGVE
jgi:hypothetical protein